MCVNVRLDFWFHRCNNSFRPGGENIFVVRQGWISRQIISFRPIARTLLNCRGPFGVRQARRTVTDVDMLRAFHSTAYSFELYRISWLFTAAGRKKPRLESFHNEMDCGDEIASLPSSVGRSLVCQVQILFHLERAVLAEL